MPLYERTTASFNRGDKQRGADYFREGRVQLDVKGNRATAQVQGKDRQSYGVGIDWSRVAPKQQLHVFCQCPRFSSGKPCKHLWATLLALAESGPQNQPPGQIEVTLRKDRKTRWRELPDLPEPKQGPQRPAKKKPAKKARPKNDHGSWKSHFASVKQDLDQLTSGQIAGPDPEMVRLLVNAGASLSADGLVLDVYEVKAGGDGEATLKPKSVDPRLLQDVLVPRSRNGASRTVFEDEVDEAVLPPGLESEEGAETGSNDFSDSAVSVASEEPIDTSRQEDAGDPSPSSETLGDAEPAPDVAQVSENGNEGPRSIPTVVPALPTQGHPRKGRRQGRSRPRPPKARRLVLPKELYDDVLPDLCQRKILGSWDGHDASSMRPLDWDGDPPWRLALRLVTEGAQGQEVIKLRGELFRDVSGNGTMTAGGSDDDLDDRLTVIPLGDPEAILLSDRRSAMRAAIAADQAVAATGALTSVLPARDADDMPSGLVLFKDHIARLETEPGQDRPWITRLRGADEIVIPGEDLEDALTTLLELPALPTMRLPDDLGLEAVTEAPIPHLALESERAPEWVQLPLRAHLSFEYGDFNVPADDQRRGIVDWREGVMLRRNMELEQQGLLRLVELGFQPVSTRGSGLEHGHGLELDPARLPLVAEPLLRDGWVVEVHGAPMRSPDPPTLRVESGVDWFELKGGLDYAGEHIDLTRALAAIARGERIIELDDGSQGILPEQWVDAYDSLAKLSHDATEEGLKFHSSQALLVDTLLAMTPPSVDRQFSNLRRKLSSWERIKSKKELRTFHGTLRGYQRHGLGWLTFLREFGLGGVLADDMGLGKTVQVLALILAHRTPAKTTGKPFLVVAPRSLVFNWIDEAARFTPDLKVVEYAGPDRQKLQGELDDYDIVLTTYSTLRRDIGYLAAEKFDTLVLDEAQAIKNRDSQAAKASRLLVGENRLALTGTPIENHLGELGSIFEFLNPSLFGRLPKLDALTGGRAPNKQELALVAEGMRPFILRRTKSEVLKDLPPKTILTLHTTLRDEQRELYDKLRLHYQANLLSQSEGGKVANPIQVLEALLRLRQVACHPGLVDEEWEPAGSAKMEMLFSHVEEILDEGHKLVIFSQFTKLLAYVRRELEARGKTYAYLDGSTRNRGDVVERFQTDPGCNLFLISIKAGGVGLNLTAAGYVFLLDPWWNPAVEAQAIDRVHRIGQTQPVFAYRLIARDTVEEKIVALQRSKSELADAILGGEGTRMSDLTADDLKMLLS